MRALLQKLTKKKEIGILFGGVLFGVVALAGYTYIAANPMGALHINQNTKELAARMVEECKDAPHAQTCYEEVVPPLLEQYEMNEVFDVIREIRRQDSGYQFCHVLAHEIGEHETEKDPEAWMDVLTKCPTDGLCSNGCMHGASVARFANETLSSAQVELAIPDLQIACEPREGWNPSALDSAICYHGVGHLSVHMTAANIPRALEICDAVAQGDEHKDRLCDEGVYMQLFQPLEPEDYALIDLLPQTPTKENIEEFCGEYGGEDEKAACWREGWPTHREELETPEGIIAFCSNGPAYNDEARCYTTVLTINARFSLNRPEFMADLCSGVPGKYQEECFEIGSTAIIEENRIDYNTAFSFCERAEDERIKDACYENLTGYVTFVYSPGAPEARAYCEHLPEKWRATCLGYLE